jgi:hypothetical protein
MNTPVSYYGGKKRLAKIILALRVLANSSYGNKLDGDFGYDRSGTNSKKLDNKRAGFSLLAAVNLAGD